MKINNTRLGLFLAGVWSRILASSSYVGASHV
jgi:hypothetical protein